MAHGDVTLERHDTVALITLDRPERQNAIDERMVARLGEAVNELESALPRAIVVTGGGSDAFSAGLDIRPGSNPAAAALLQAVQQQDRGAIEKLLARLRQPVDRLMSLPVPVIAAVNGIAFGAGAEIVARCDLRVADAGAIFCFINTRMGLMPSFGGVPALTRLVGPARAADLLLSARKFRATEALGLGMLNRLAEPGMAAEEALKFANSIASNGPRAVRATLRVLRESAGVSLDEGLQMELGAAAGVFASGEFAYGLQAIQDQTEAEFPDIP